MLPAELVKQLRSGWAAARSAQGGARARVGWRAGVVMLTGAIGLMGVMQVPQVAVAGSPQTAGPGLDWPQSLHAPQHSSLSNATAFTPSNAASVNQVWHWQPPMVSGEPAPVLDASPTVVAGLVYIGAASGGVYALHESTRPRLWRPP